MKILISNWRSLLYLNLGHVTPIKLLYKTTDFHRDNFVDIILLLWVTSLLRASLGNPGTIPDDIEKV
jgi:hypothetical protein